MHFLNPVALWLLLVAPPLAVATTWWAWRRKTRFLKEYGDWKLISRFTAPLSRRWYIFKAVCGAIALSALVIGIARPSFQNARIEYPVGTIDVIAVLDVSRSMATQDYPGKIPGDSYQAGTRLDMGRYLLLKQLVPALGFNRLGVVTFCGSAFPQSFLTDDMPALEWVLQQNLRVGCAPGEGSQLADALKMSAALFDLDSPPNHKRVLVLFSDGGNDSDEAKLADAIAGLQKRNVQIVIAGVGSKTPRPIPISQLSQGDQYRYANQQWYTLDGQVVTSTRDETMLIGLKDRIGGRYSRIDQPSDFDFGSLVAGVDYKIIRGEREVFIYPLLTALLFTVLAVLSPRKPVRNSFNIDWRKLLLWRRRSRL